MHCPSVKFLSVMVPSIYLVRLLTSRPCGAPVAVIPPSTLNSESINITSQTTPSDGRMYAMNVSFTTSHLQDIV